MPAVGDNTISSRLLTGARRFNIVDLRYRNTGCGGTAASDCSGTVTGTLLLFTFAKKNRLS